MLDDNNKPTVNVSSAVSKNVANGNGVHTNDVPKRNNVPIFIIVSVLIVIFIVIGVLVAMGVINLIKN